MSKNKIQVDIGIVVYVSLLACCWYFGAIAQHNTALKEHRAKIRSRAEAQAISYRVGLSEMEGLKAKSKAKYYFQIVRDYINN